MAAVIVRLTVCWALFFFLPFSCIVPVYFK
jgi:hypothetical protein